MASGIGRATALGLAAAGWNLALVDRDVAGLKLIRDVVEEVTYGQLITISGDLSEPAEARRAVDVTAEYFGRLDGLGYALFENLRIGANGEVIDDDLESYRLPGAADVPPIDIALLENPCPYGPLGAKGAAEPPIIQSQR